MTEAGDDRGSRRSLARKMQSGKLSEAMRMPRHALTLVTDIAAEQREKARAKGLISQRPGLASGECEAAGDEERPA